MCVTDDTGEKWFRSGHYTGYLKIVFPSLLPPNNILAKKSSLLKKNYRIPVDHIPRITNEGFVKTSHWPMQYWGMYDGS
jgi:hypothetical protein